MLSLLFSKLFGASPLASVASKRTPQQHGGDTMRRGDRRDVHRLRRGSAERERKRLHARIEKRDLELPIGNGLRLPDQLIEAWLRISPPHVPCSKVLCAQAASWIGARYFQVS